MKRIAVLLTGLLVFGAILGGALCASAAETYTLATVVKLSGVNWFQRMEEGVLAFGKATGHTTFQQGPAKADAALQVQVVEDLIAQQVNALCVVPSRRSSRTGAQEGHGSGNHRRHPRGFESEEREL
jgi:simple sugar transport system substrate-binding protein